MTTSQPATESVALVESDPVAVPTFLGTVVVEDLPAGEHQLTVNGPGSAPHSERLEVTDEGGPDVAGVDGQMPLVPATDAIKLEVDADGTEADIQRLAVEDDFGGRLYESPIDGPDAVYVHRGGAYTTAVQDAEGAFGALRVNPDRGGDDDGGPVRIESPRTGKASLAGFVSTIGEETASSVEAVTDVSVDEAGDTVEDTVGVGGENATARTETGDAVVSTETGDDDDELPSGNTRRQTGGVTGLLRALEAVLSAADRAAGRADSGDRSNADRALETEKL